MITFSDYLRRFLASDLRRFRVCRLAPSLELFSHMAIAYFADAVTIMLSILLPMPLNFQSSFIIVAATPPLIRFISRRLIMPDTFITPILLMPLATPFHAITLITPRHATIGAASARHWLPRRWL